MCVLSWSLWIKFFSHLVHLCGFSLCHQMCQQMSIKKAFVSKLLVAFGPFIWRLTSMCSNMSFQVAFLWELFGLLNSLPHSLHLYGSSPEWIRKWTCRCWILENIFPHTEHSWWLFASTFSFSLRFRWIWRRQYFSAFKFLWSHISALSFRLFLTIFWIMSRIISFRRLDLLKIKNYIWHYIVYLLI